MIASGYSLDLYCRHEHLPTHYSMSQTPCPPGHHVFGEFPHVYFAEKVAECRADARRDGWVFNRDGDVTCPRCARASVSGDQ